MDANPKIIRLLKSLHEATRQGRIQWAESFEPSVFEVRVNDARMFIKEIQDAGGEEYYFNVTNTKGSSIDTELFNEPGEGLNSARDLFALARRNALKVDDFLDRVIAEVDKNRG